MLLLRLCLPLVMLAGLLAAAPAHAAPRPLVYAVVIDGLDGDRVDAGQAPFIASLLNGQNGRATYYPESRAIMVAETNPNHVGMMTGAYTNKSGIAGNAFAIYAPTADEDSCKLTGPVNLSARPSVASGENGNCPVAETVFAAIKRQGNPDGLITAGIFGKAKLGAIFSAKTVNPAARDIDHLWAPCTSRDDDDDYCADVPVEPVNRDRTLQDSIVMDEVLRTIRQGVRAGAVTRRPDFTFVNLPQVDNGGHAFGGMSAAYDTAISLADAEIKRLVDELKALGEWQRTVLVLLSDHSHDTTLTKTNAAGALTSAGIPSSAFVAVNNGSVDMIYLADRAAPSRFALLKRMRQVLTSQATIDEALYREPNPEDGGPLNTLDGAHPEWHAAGDRTGDLFVTHKPGGAFLDPDTGGRPNLLPGNHGSPFTRDNFFAVTGGGQAVRQGSIQGQVRPRFEDAALNPGQAENVDLAPTVMGLFGLLHTRNNAARFLSEAIDGHALVGQGSPTVPPTLSVRRLSPLNRAQARTKTRRFRLSFGPAGGRFDVQVHALGLSRTLLTSSGARSVTFTGRTYIRYFFRARVRSAAGTPSRYRTRVIQPGGTRAG